MTVLHQLAPLYLRTPRGRMAAFNGIPACSVEQKTALFAIDGKTSTQALMADLREMGNPSQLLAQLESAGLIEAKHAPQRAPTRTEADNAIWGAPSSSFFGSGLDNILTDSGLDATAPAPLSKTMAVPSEEKITENLIGQITDTMSSFILEHLPQHAFGVLGELERVRSTAQLRLILPSYGALVETTGDLGRGHLRHVQAFIAQRL